MTKEQLQTKIEELETQLNEFRQQLNNFKECPKIEDAKVGDVLEDGSNEPTDTEILEFLLNQFKSYSLQMNGQHSYRFMNDGFPMNRAKGPNVRNAIIVAMREQQESMRKLKEKYPGWGEE